MRWNCSIGIWCGPSIKVRIIMRIIHYVWVWIWFKVRFVTVLIIVGNCWVLENQCTIWSNERLVRWMLFLKVIPSRHCRCLILGSIGRRVAFIDIIVHIKRFVALHHCMAMRILRSPNKRNSCSFCILLLLILVVDLHHILVQTAVIFALLVENFLFFVYFYGVLLDTIS